MVVVKSRRSKSGSVRKVRSNSKKSLPVLKANMFGIDFREIEDCTNVSFEFIDVRVLGEVGDYVEVVSLADDVVYKIGREEFGKIVVGSVGMIHEFSGSRYGYSYLPF